ncbi:MAG TPA: hypothetical protein VMV17_07265 [Streptosporangiaceae bacterium]|nr:hypothetical protein [Streptosporangiaceae bacterium]
MAGYLPPGWPTGVHPPGSADFERTAVAWLLDVVPPDYRLYGVLRRHPVALATLARHHLAGCVEGARQGYRTARTELGATLPVPGLDAVLDAYRSEGSRLVTTARAVDLVERALRGEVFTPRLRDQPGHPAAPPGKPDRSGAAGPAARQEEAGPAARQEGPEPAAREEAAATRAGRNGTTSGPGREGAADGPARKGAAAAGRATRKTAADGKRTGRAKPRPSPA